MTHLTPDEFVDSLDGVLPPARLAHLAACEACRRQAAEMRDVLGDAQATAVPEPSPLFWDHLSARVQAAIADDATTRRSRWFDWPVLAPVAGLVMLVLALVSSVQWQPRVEPGTRAAADTRDVSDAEFTVADSQWAVLAELVGELDVEAATEAGIATAPGSADGAVLHLSSSEQQELLRLLQEELKAGS